MRGGKKERGRGAEEGTGETSVFVSITNILFFSGFFGHHLGSKFTRTDQNEPNNHIGPDCAGHAKLK